MKHILLVLVMSALIPHSGFPAPLKFQKLTPHFYLLEMAGDQPNVGAFVGEDGLLLINAPGEKELLPVLEALKRVSPKPVRWALSTDYVKESWGCPAPLRDQGALLLASKASYERSRSDGLPPDGGAGRGSLFFDRQLHLFEAGVEVRIFAPQVKPQSTDTIVFVPAEKVLQVGAMFQPGRFPRVEETAEAGVTLAWIDALKQVVDFVPLLKSAMPQPKPDPAKVPAEDKTLEELVLVVPAHGSVSNLQEMKTLLEAAQRVRNEVTRAANAGRRRESVTGLPALTPYRNMPNFETFTLKLYDAAAASDGK
jgi:hypothetical protein